MILRRIIAAFAILCALATYASAQTGSVKTPSQLNGEVNSTYPDNTQGQITPFGIRQVSLDQIASVPFLNSANAFTGSNSFAALVNFTGTFQINGNTMTFPGVGATLGALAVAQTWSANQTFSATVNFTGPFQISGTAETFPASGSLAGTSDTQTFTNKTINGASNTLTVRAASDVTGQIPTANGGTGVNAPTNNAVYKGQGSSPMVASALTDNGTIVSSSESIDTTTNAHVQEIANAGSTGTTINKLAKLTGSPATAVIATTSDTTGNVIGIVTGGAGTTGSAQIAITGQASCVFDGAITAGHYVQVSTSAGGSCHDGGGTFPTSGQILGFVVAATNASPGATPQAVTLFAPGTVGTNASSAGTVTSVTCGTGLSGGTITTSGTCAVSLTSASNALGTNTTISTSALTTLATAAMGTTGTFFCTGTLTWSSTSGSANVLSILTDGTTKFAGTTQQDVAVGTPTSQTVSGTITTPAASILLQAEANVGTTTAQTNLSGSSHDTQLTCVRIS